MTYPPQDYLIIFRSKGNRLGKTFDPLDWLAAMTAYIPDQREQRVDTMVSIVTSPRNFVLKGNT